MENYMIVTTRVAPGYAMLVAPGFALEWHDPERPKHNTGDRDEVKRIQPGLRFDARAVPHVLKTPGDHAWTAPLPDVSAALPLP